MRYETAWAPTELFVALLMKNRKGSIPKRLVSFDPGHTTGYAVFEGMNLIAAGTIATVVDDKPHWCELEQLLLEYDPTCLLVENYRVYEHKLDRHSFSEVHTLRIIGGIDFWAFQNRVPISYQMASTGKGFATDSQLVKFGYCVSNRHARDAVRHGVHFLLFHNKDGSIAEKEVLND